MVATVPIFQLAPELVVSKLCLGTMTFGEQNSLPESFRLLDQAFGSGINFFDTAEMYPVPQRRETQGRSEEFIGAWLRSRKVPRDRVVLATKGSLDTWNLSSFSFQLFGSRSWLYVTGPSGQMTWIRDGPKCLDAANISDAIDKSLLRMQTDFIDLYQIHWPDRYVPMFGETDYDSSRQFTSVPMEDQLEALGRAVADGKVRYIGLSNETPYGLMSFLHIANNVGYPKIISLQNSYNLLCRTFDSGLAECCHHERVSLLAYSPMAMGILSGKYFSHDGGPLDARMNLFQGRYSEGETRYNFSNPVIRNAVMEYNNIAIKYSISPAALAIAFVLSQPLVGSAIFGATKPWQLDEVLEALNIQLTEEIMTEINLVHAKFPNPCP